MKQLTLLVMFCLLLAACQNQGASDSSGSTSQAAPPASVESSAAVPAPAPEPEKNPGGAEPAATELQGQLAHHNFVLKSFDGQEFSGQNPDGSRREPPYMSFGEWPNLNGRVCNSFRGMVEVQGHTLTMKNAASTMMLCLEELNRVENAFHQMMNEGASVKIEGRDLTLEGAGHVLLFTLSDYVN